MIPVTLAEIAITLIPKPSVPVVKMSYTILPVKQMSMMETSISKNFSMDLSTFINNNNSGKLELSMKNDSNMLEVRG